MVPLQTKINLWYCEVKMDREPMSIKEWADWEASLNGHFDGELEGSHG